MRLCARIGVIVLSVYAFLPAAEFDGVHDYFGQELWPKVGSKTCVNCHTAAGAAGGARFILRDPSKEPADQRAAALEQNRVAFETVARLRADGEWLALLKAVNRIPHGGGAVLKPGSAEFQVLERFVRGVNETPADAKTAPNVASAPAATALFDSISMVDDRRLLRRLTLSLAGRLPSDSELSAVQSQGLSALNPILDAVMNEAAFYDRLGEGFNDFLLTRGYEGLPERALSYEHFGNTRGWYQKYDLSAAGDEAAQRKARNKLIADYREAMLREPLELIKYIVRENRPFTEIVTADYIMVSPYTARGYGVYDEVRGQFQNPEDPFEFVPVRIKALRSRDGWRQDSATGYYPHAGILSSFQYLMRYPTTETNRNRLRARMFYQHFLGVDVMRLALRVNDAAAITMRYKKPTMEAPDCVVCHQTVDPVAGLFQDYYVVDAKGVYGPRQWGWFKDMFEPGFEGRPLPKKERWRALQWLGEQTAQDPRFAVAMVEHVYYILAGRRPLLAPENADDPLYGAKQNAYLAQRREIEAIAARFAESGFNLKSVFKELAASNFYRADGVLAAARNPEQTAQLEDVGFVHLLTPEQLARKIEAIFHRRWRRLDGPFEILYGGIDSKQITERNADPSGAMGALQRMMANEMACSSVGLDFTTPPAQRHLFPAIELDVVPGESAAGDQRIREAIVLLHRRLLGRFDSPGDPEVDRTFQLFAGIVGEAASRGDFELRDAYICRGADDKRIADPLYTLRAWRAVVTYLLRQYEFLYE